MNLDEAAPRMGVTPFQHHPFSVALDVFEGPLDLLLHLVQQHQLDITAVSLMQVTGQYLAQLRGGENIDHRALADFVAIGARLLELKSRALLPSPPPLLQIDEDVDESDLVEMLRRYQQFKAAALLLRGREEAVIRAFPRLAAPPDVPPLTGLGAVTLERLAELVQRALARLETPPEPEPLRRPLVTVRQKIDEIALLLRLAGSLSFAAVLQSCRTREEVVAAFLAVLEMLKSELLLASQDAAFGDIALLPVCEELTNADPEPEAQAASEPELARV